MPAQETKDIFSQKMFFRLLIPSTAAAIPYTIGDTVDAIIVGNYIGTTGLAALGICSCVFLFYDIVMCSLRLGGASRFSVLLGKGDVEGAEKCFRDTFKVSLMIGFLIAAAGLILINPLTVLLGGTPAESELFSAVRCYLTTILMGAPAIISHYVLELYLINGNHEKIANLGSVVGSVTNVFLTFLFVAGFHMGVLGAGLSIALSNLISVLCYIPILVQKGSHFLDITDGQKKTKKSFWKEKTDFRQVWAYFRSGLSVNIDYLYQIIFLLVMNNALIRTVGGAGVAIFEITRNLYYFYIYIWEGNAKAVQPLVSTYLSEKNYVGIQYVKKLGLSSCIVINAAITVLSVFCPHLICAIFGYAEPAHMAEAYFAIRLYALSAFWAGIYTFYTCYYQAIHHEKYATIMNTIRGCFCNLFCVALFLVFWPKHIWCFYPASELLAFSIYLLWSHFDKIPEFNFDMERIFSKTITNKEENMVLVSNEIWQFCEKWGVDSSKRYYISLAVEELGVLTLKYGFIKKKSGYLHITVIAKEGGEVTFCMRDTAEAFDPFSLKLQKKVTWDDGNFDTVGLMILKEKSDSFHYRNYQGFNTIQLQF